MMASSYSSHSYSSHSYQSRSSNLEYAVSNSEIAKTRDIEFNPIQTNYKQKRYLEGYLTNSKLSQSYFTNSPFLLQSIETKFIGDVKDISEHIEKAFRIITGEEFPDDISIHVCSKERLKEFHNEVGGSWSNGISGFAVNRKKSGQRSEIFVCQGELANAIATIGHEIGHCISAPLDNARDEEAKAFAFEFAWVKSINDNNIAGLRGCFNLANPAKNNVHDAAFSFVHGLVKRGIDAVKLCFGLINKELSVGSDL